MSMQGIRCRDLVAPVTSHQLHYDDSVDKATHILLAFCTLIYNQFTASLMPVLHVRLMRIVAFT